MGRRYRMTDLTYKSYRIGEQTELDSGMEPYVSPDFEDAVITHILGNYVGNDSCPLFLAIHGKMGNGKTFQTLCTCSKYHITMYYISAAELSGAYEQDSTHTIDCNLKDARKRLEQNHEYSVFIIDDFHLSIASTEAGVGKTVNSQLLTGYLMNLSDSAKQSKIKRIPFILLGNDFNNLYAPLTRDGRMNFYEWNPSVEEKACIVASSMEDLYNDDKTKEELMNLVYEYPDMPVSFFTELRHDLYREHMMSFIKKSKVKNIARLITTYESDSQNPMNFEQEENALVKKLKELAETRISHRNNAMTVHESREKLYDESQHNPQK